MTEPDVETVAPVMDSSVNGGIILKVIENDFSELIDIKFAIPEPDVASVTHQCGLRISWLHTMVLQVIGSTI